MKKLLYTILLLYFISCEQGGGFAPSSPDSSVFQCPSTVAEIAECSATINPGASPVTVTGTAQFFKRTITSQSSSLILGAPIPAALAIKFAEVRVLNSSGTVIQCGTTSNSGALLAVDGVSSLQIPNTAGAYTVEVLSRANRAMNVSGVPGKPAFQLYTSVKNDFCKNEPHKVSANITSDGITASSPSLIAYARESESSSLIQGGAFNIYNNLVTTYEYLASNTGTVNISCLNPKLNIYWQAGFNPAQYVYPNENPSTVPNISFYIRGQNELYINGGKLGNVSTADTDHFDDAVIIHEIGHHIESVCGKMDSPGGTHNGLFRIDPRLSWSEGWGNYMGAHIVQNNLNAINPDPALSTILGAPGWVYYLDTKGYKDGASGTASEIIKISLIRAGSNPEIVVNNSPFVSTCGTEDLCFDKVDPVINPGEGHFREVAIARSLFKSTNTCASGCTNRSDYFDEVWKSIDKITGMGQSIYPFRSSVRFYERLHAAFSNSTPAAIDSILNTDEAVQRSNSADYTISGNLTWPTYGVKLVPTMTACNLEIRPRNEDTAVTDVFSDQRYSNHFYFIDKATSLPSVTSITLNATKLAGTSLDLDLILYQEGYSFVTDTAGTKTTSSAQFIKSARGSGFVNKTISSLDTLSLTMPYLLNVRAFTTGTSVSPSTQYTYTLTTNNVGEYLCPTTF
ncbi:MAG: hypothetical protein AABY53_05235 [Bdellovibrionota bacterium]